MEKSGRVELRPSSSICFCAFHSLYAFRSSGVSCVGIAVETVLDQSWDDVPLLILTCFPDLSSEFTWQEHHVFGTDPIDNVRVSIIDGSG